MSADLTLPPDSSSSSSSDVSGVGMGPPPPPPPITTAPSTGSQDTIATAGTKTLPPVGTSSSTPSLAVPNVENMSDAEIVALISGSLDHFRRLRSADQSNSTTSLQLADVQKVKTNDPSSPSIHDSLTGDNSSSGTTIVKSTAFIRTLETSLSQAIYETTSERLKKSYQPMTLNLIQEFVHEVTRTGIVNILIPTLAMMQDPLKPNTFNTSLKTADIAVKVAHADQLNELVSSGAIKNLANQLFPTDPSSAKAFTKETQSLFLELALEQTGTALKLPGYKAQVFAQAKAVRDTQNNLADPTQVSKIVANLQSTSQEGVSKPADAVKATQAIEEALTNGPFNTRAELQIALKQAFRNQFQELPESSTTSLALNAEKSALDAVLKNSSSQQLAFNAAFIDVPQTEDSIKNAILKEFRESDEAIHAAATAEALTKEIFTSDLQSRYKSAEQIRTSIKEALPHYFDDLPKTRAESIVARVDLGIPQNSPLQHVGLSSGTLSPNEFKDQLHEVVTNQTNFPPFSELHHFVDRVSGLENRYDGSNMIALINESHRTERTQTPSYLNLDAQTALKEHQKQILDPAGSVVLSWASMMNGMPQPEKNQKTIYGPI
jgi:hypothetical protein